MNEKTQKAVPVNDAQDDVIALGQASVETKGPGPITNEPFGTRVGGGISE